MNDNPNAFAEDVLEHIHRLNNALASIEGFTAVLQESLEKGSENREIADKVYRAAEQAITISDELFTLSSKYKKSRQS